MQHTLISIITDRLKSCSLNIIGYYLFGNMQMLVVERVIILRAEYSGMSDKRTMPVCFTPDQLKIVEDYAKRKGMLNVSQAIEELTR